MSGLFRLSGAVDRDPAIDAWFSGPVRLDPQIDAWLREPDDALRRLARDCFERLRAAGPDVRELIHDGCPVACVQGAAFAYVNVHKAHVSVGFFHGAALDDPAGLLQGAGKHMRHVKLRQAPPVNTAALNELIAAAYRDIHARLAAEPA